MESIQLTAKTVTFRILRFKPNRIDPPRYQEFPLKIEPDMSVLDGLEKIRRPGPEPPGNHRKTRTA